MFCAYWLLKNVLLIASLNPYFPLFLEQLGWNSGSSFVLNTEYDQVVRHYFVF